ncbi:MAG: glyoxylate/hydroxypyruvate reductase A [Casimicrobiaceae bacterium]|nr:glyoxylate/hydroxypyruvate reductase A [Casimicrobiaceae bacterium]
MRLLVQSAGIDGVPAIVAEIARLAPEIECVAWPSDLPCDYAVVWKPPAELFACQPKLRAVFNFGAGVDAILAMKVVPEHLPIIRLEDAGMAQQMAEYALYGVLHHHRQMGRYAAQQRDGVWLPHEDRANRRRPTVGVMGLGEMGGHVARRIAGFGYPVRGWSRRLRALEGIETFAGLEGPRGLDVFLAGTEVLVLALPLTEATYHLIDASRLACLPRGSFLVNAGRGALVVEADLLAALDSGQLAGALLDVFETEPLPPDHPLWRHPKVLITPHIAAITPVPEACAQIVEKLRALEAGRPVSGIVNRTAGY